MNTLDLLTVYLGSSGKARPVFKEAARGLGKRIGENGKSLVYGGMDAGLMGLLAQSALDHGAHVTGIIPKKIKDSERILQNLSETILVEELCDRKKRMFLMADAVIALPGGFGTLDESLEVLYWGALGMHQKPLVLVDLEEYWTPIIKFLYTLPVFDARYLIVCKSLDEIIPDLKHWDAPQVESIKHEHYPHFEDEIMRDTNEPIIIDKASVENAYFLICALGLKQLGKHNRGIGILNTNGQFDGLIEWIHKAAQEHFITPKCLKLFSTADTREELEGLLKTQENVSIDLHAEKWGKANIDE